MREMTTIRALIHRLLPGGTRFNTDRKPCGSWEQIPLWPPNVFAVAAQLVERSGCYRHLIGPLDGGGFSDPFGVVNPVWQRQMGKRAKAWAWGLIQDRSSPGWAELEASCRAKYLLGDELLATSLDPLRNDWRELYVKYGDEDVHLADLAPRPKSDLPRWWSAALRLLITADQSCEGIGFIPRSKSPAQACDPPRPGEPSWVEFIVLDQVAKLLKSPSGDLDAGYLSTVTDKLYNPAMGAVLPKTRTSTLGCTLRSMSHNLALLPPAGQVQARWRVSGVRPIEATTRSPGSAVQSNLNILLVPFPYRISADSFRGVTANEGDKWGYFHVDQKWLPPATVKTDKKTRADLLDELSIFVANLVRSACNGKQEVHGVIFPELSLDTEAFNAIAERLRKDAAHTGFEFIIAGTSQEPLPPGAVSTPRAGNFAAFLGLPRRALDGKYVDQNSWGLRGAREKHHRWKLNKAQIRRYALSSGLDAKTDWWEGIPISPRVVEFFEVRGGTSMTVLICEDLARADPCQAVVRAVGPNLVVALLMDGPQRAFRWPGHYAGVLADDPGSSVLTLTSFGLIQRALATDPSQNRSVAFFKDSSGAEREIPLPTDAHALLLSLEAQPKEEHTLDGRGDGGAAYIWHLSEVTPVRANNDCAKNWILGLE
ncbi:MAG: hypothetical protein K2W86_13075 [Sphingomonas sp.]|uniref:hypothetical protein n=1 Tax=Sphingomonas sp. TaxID=28214 RepID=UPI0035A89177|nr:hypothetical protein [Sphingomonas sp.]